MDVVVAGGHGQIALQLLRLLAERGDRARGLIRNPDHAADLEAVGAEPVLCDLEAEDDIARFVEGADAVVFAAGRGPGQRRGAQADGGPGRRGQADRGRPGERDPPLRDGERDRRRQPERVAEAMGPTWRPRRRPTGALEESGLDYTIVTPGGLTDEPRQRAHAGRARDIGSGTVPRADVAATLLAVLDTPRRSA